LAGSFFEWRSAQSGQILIALVSVLVQRYDQRLHDQEACILQDEVPLNHPELVEGFDTFVKQKDS
jgi:hypothetical protein